MKKVRCEEEERKGVAPVEWIRQNNKKRRTYYEKNTHAHTETMDMNVGFPLYLRERDRRRKSSGNQAEEIQIKEGSWLKV